MDPSHLRLSALTCREQARIARDPLQRHELLTRAARFEERADYAALQLLEDDRHAIAAE
jgi:hypothetical protein